VDRLLVIDAVAAKQPPGTLIRLANEEIPSHPGLVLSPHQMGLRDLLAALELLDCTPAEIVLWGVEPASLETGVELTPVVAAQVNALIECVLEELRNWGVEPQLLQQPTQHESEWQPPVVASELEGV
jgi:hydrogenase maturation protease